MYNPIPRNGESSTVFREASTYTVGLDVMDIFSYLIGRLKVDAHSMHLNLG